MKHLNKAIWLVACAIVLNLADTRVTLAGPHAQAGPYSIEVTTDPAVVPVGKAKLNIKVTDDAGQPVPGAQVSAIARMPGMPMGEHEETALPEPGRAGVYTAPAAFPMAGAYTADIQINGPKGPATVSLSLQTGEDTTPASGNRPLMAWLPWLLGLAVLAFLLYRVWRSGQRPHWRAVFNRQVIGALLLLAVILAISVYAVRHYRRPGSMTPVEAQSMEMNLPAPPGVAPVELALVQRGTVQNTVRYTGQAVGYVEQDIYPRVTGIITWMPFYVGNHIRRGQLLARLDTSQISPQVAQQRAAQAQAQEGTAVARIEYQQALGAVNQAEAELGQRQSALDEARSGARKAVAEVGVKRGALEEAQRLAAKARADATGRYGALAEARGMEKKARAALIEAQNDLQAAQAALTESQNDVTATQEERSNAEADVESEQSQVVDAQAQLQAAQADLAYWTKEIERMTVLVREGAVSRDEFQREQAQAESAAAKVRQAQAGVSQAQARVRGAQSRVRKADAMTKSAQARANQAQAKIGSGQSRIEQAQADIVTASAKSQQATAAIEAAQSEIGAAGARVRQMAADLRATQTDVVAANARVQQTLSELEAHHAHVMQMQAAAGAARQRIAQAQAGVEQARAGVAGATTTLGYTEIRAETDGVITQRLISPGVLVSPGQALLKVAQIQPIRLQANVAESDLANIHVGTPVTVRSRSDTRKVVTARVTSISPAVDPAARTGIVEAIVPNTNESFLPGQYVVMEISTGQSLDALRVLSRAIQWHTIPTGGIISAEPTPYVWLAEPGQNNRFTVRQVDIKAGASDGTYTAIVAGLKAGQQVVTAGYQSLKNGDTVAAPEAIAAGAQGTTTNMPAMPGMGGGNAPRTDVAPEQTGGTQVPTPQTAHVAVTANGFEPASLRLRPHVPARIVFERKTDQTCATEVVFPDYGIKKALPLNQPMTVEFTPHKTGEFTYSCGMNMLHGKLVIQ
jgi:RND family efflux transporter MFP subunit